MRTRLLLVALTLAAWAGPAAAQEYRVPPPLGVWQRTVEEGRFTFTIEPDRLRLTAIDKDGRNVFLLEADYGVTKDSVLFGVIASAEVSKDEAAVSEPDTPFSLRFRVDGDVLTIKGVKGFGKKGGTELQGRYKRVEGRDAEAPVRPVVRPASRRYVPPADTVMPPASPAPPAPPRRPPQAAPASPAATTGWMPVPVPPWVTERLEGKHEVQVDRRTPILPPIRPGVPMPKCAEPPDEADILRAMPQCCSIPGLYEERREDIQIVVERLVDRLDPPRFFPLIGPARLHHCHWKCTVYYDDVIEGAYPFPFRCKKPRIQVIYMDRDHIHLCDAKDVKR